MKYPNFMILKIHCRIKYKLQAMKGEKEIDREKKNCFKINNLNDYTFLKQISISNLNYFQSCTIII